MNSVAIVGGGAVGMFCAAQLAKRGVRVTLLEASAEDFSVHGPAASLAAAGMLAPLSEAAREPEPQPALDALCLASFDLWRARSGEAIWGDGVRFAGAAVLARDEAHGEALSRQFAALGRKAEPLSRGGFRKRVGLEGAFAHALYVEDEGVLDPQRVLSGLAMEARRHGAQLLFGHDVETVGPGVAQCFGGARVEADVVLLAPGAWASTRLVTDVPAMARVQPAKGHMIPVEVDGELGANVRGAEFYLARRGATDVVLGGDMQMAGYDRRVDPERVSAMFACAEAVLPGQVRARPDAPVWTGLRPMSPDGAPLVGPSGVERVLIAAGHSRNGWLLAPLTADIICAHVLGEALDARWAAFLPQRFEETSA